MTYKKKLIEVALPLEAISEASASEKTLKNSHPANLHLWWARRPLAAARAVIWASLVDDPSSHPEFFPTIEEQVLERKRLFAILERLVQWQACADKSLLTQAHDEIARYLEDDVPPRILDPFGGGGAIPLEALRLGLDTSTSDLNPVAVLIQRAMLQVVPRFANARVVRPDTQACLHSQEQLRGIAIDLEYYGKRLRDEAHAVVGHSYPDVQLGTGGRGTPIAWIWARTVRSPDPSWPHHVPLVKSWIVSKKSGRPPIHVVPQIDRADGSIQYNIEVGGSPAEPTVSRGNGVCIATGSPIPSDYIKEEAAAGRLGCQLLAVVVEGIRQRTYVAASEVQVAASQVRPPDWVPVGSMSDHPQYMGTPRYGLDEWSKLFTSRQLNTLTAFVDGLGRIHAEIAEDAREVGVLDDDVPFADGGTGCRAYADALILLLALAIDKLADLNNSLAQWEPVAQCPRHLFGRQAIQMTWDFAEANPFSDSSGSYSTIIDGMARTLAGPAFALHFGIEANVEQQDACSRLRGMPSVVVSTDPPYYDNVPYADLSDFFYVWLRRGLNSVFPSDTATLLSPKAEELVADVKRYGSRAAAHEHFEKGMESVFTQLAESQDERYPATIFYAFKAVEEREGSQVSTGWSSFLSSMINSGLSITATWPIRTENRSRLRGMNSNALASSIVLACRRRPLDAPLATRGEFIGRLRQELTSSIRILQEQNIAPVDLAQSAIGPGISIFSGYAKVVEADGSSMTVVAALGLINEVLSQTLSGEESELDPESRFAVTWFEQYGHGEGPFGNADLLAKAKDTTVEGVCEAGIALSRNGQVRLVERKDFPIDWIPATDDQLTVWQTTQRLIRALESSEVEAARLLDQLGPGYSERARQLAYLLYGICDRKHWAEDAGAYNMLVTAWPELVRLASGSQRPRGEERLFQ